MSSTTSRYALLIASVVAAVFLGCLVTYLIVRHADAPLQRFTPCLHSEPIEYGTAYTIYAYVYQDGSSSCVVYPDKDAKPWRYQVDPQWRPTWFLAGGNSDFYEAPDCDRLGRCPA